MLIPTLPRAGTTALCLISATFAAATALATVIGQISDPPDVSVEAAVDIVSAQIEQVGGRLTFSIQTRGPIPTSLPNPQDHLTYLWLVDTDEDPGTGQPHGTLGSEFNVRAVIGEQFGGGFVDVCGSVPGGGGGTVTVSGNQIGITIYLNQIGSPSDFNWRCGTFHIANGQWVSGNAETIIAHADTLFYVPPARVRVTTPLLMLSPAGPAAGQLQVEIRDTYGNLLPNDQYVLAFHSSYEPVATVDGNGLVTAHTVPTQHSHVPYIDVWADGVGADNAACIRVSASDLGIVHDTYPGEHVSFYLPASIGDVDLESITLGYQVVTANDMAYVTQREAIGTTPFNSGTQYLVLDVADDPLTVPCGASGNPVRLGWLLGPPNGNSCYIITATPVPMLQWFVMFHEVGHNFSWRAWSFGQFCSGPSPSHNGAYSEGLASLAAMWSWSTLNRCPGALQDLALNDVNRDLVGYMTYWRWCLQQYQAAGANYAMIDANHVDGILCEMYDLLGPRAWYDLFSTFQPQDQPLPIQLDTIEKQATWFVASMSVTAGQDLRPLLAILYGFPIDNASWPAIYSAVAGRIAQRPWQPPPACDLDCDHDVDQWDFERMEGCLGGVDVAPGTPCRPADFQLDGDVDLADFALFQQAFGGS